MGSVAKGWSAAASAACLNLVDNHFVSRFSPLAYHTGMSRGILF